MLTALARYIEALVVSQGPLTGHPFNLLPWEKRFLGGAFRPDVSTASLSIGRGNGKTSLVSAIGAACVNGPLARPRAEVVLVASSFGQAHIAFEHCLSFLAPAIDGEPGRFRVLDPTNAASVEDRTTGARLRCLGSDPRRLHGLAPVLVLCDEPAQWPPGMADKMLAALLTAGGKQAGFRLVGLGTMPDDPDHWFSKMALGNADFSMVFQADHDADWRSPKTWAKANPSMRYWPTLRKAISADAERAKKDVSLVPPFKALRLNQGVTDVAEDTLLEVSTWTAAEVDAVDKTSPYVLGLDLGTNASQSAASGYFLNGSLDASPSGPRSQASRSGRGMTTPGSCTPTCTNAVSCSYWANTPPIYPHYSGKPWPGGADL